MITRFYCSPVAARALTKASKKHGFYFRTLSATDNNRDVYCEAVTKGLEYIDNNHIEIRIVENERLRIGARIAALRQARGMTQAQLAEACGMKAPNIARIETGRYSTGLDILAKIAQALDCTLDFIENP